MFVPPRHRQVVWCFAVATVAFSCGTGAQTLGSGRLTLSQQAGLTDESRVVGPVRRPTSQPGTAIRPADRADAEAIVRRAIDAVGGAERWRSVHTLVLRGRGFRNHLGDSEWFEGPFITTYFDIDEWHDLVSSQNASRVTQHFEMDTNQFTYRTIATLGGTTVLSVNGSSESPSPAATDSTSVLLGPGRLLPTALAASDLHQEPDTVMRLVPHHVIAFHAGRVPVRLFMEAESGFLRMVETRRAYPYDVFWNAWGDIIERIRYTNFTVESSGIVYPRQIDVERMGLPYSSISYGVVAVNGEIPAGTFDFDTVARAKAPCGFGCLLADSVPLGVGGAGGVSATAPGRGDREISPGIIQIVGGWNSTLVRQPDGIVVIEAPISAGYSRQVIAEAGRRFPGEPVKAVVTTTDFWWHVAGIREYIARGIPIYVLDRNVRVITDRSRARHITAPDSLARAPRAPVIRVVGHRMTLGTGDNRIELIPFRTEGLDRMMMAYLPGPRLVYTAEAVQLYPNGLTSPQTAIEAVTAVRREGLRPDRFLGMHVAATPWTTLTAILDSLAGPKKN